MNPLKTAAAVVLLSGCVTPEERGHEALMNLIEEKVQLPNGARHISKFARYYAESDNGEVVAVYLIPFEDEVAPAEGCEELLENFASRKVPCEQFQPDWKMPAGERRWIDHAKDLPNISDGGCAQVTIIFDKARSVVKSARCNGVA